MSDKIRQAIDEIDIATSDSERFHIEPDLKEALANKIALFISKGVGNPNPIRDTLRKVHEEGKYPLNTPQGRGDNIDDYANRIMAMFSVSSGASKLVKKEGGKMLLQMTGEAPKADPNEEMPHIPSAVEKENLH